MSDLKPSVFTEHPWDSLSQNTETEIVAQNIMVIRERLGNQWSLTWSDYKREREKDGGRGCCGGEKLLFDDVIHKIPDAIGAISFSPTWAKAARAASKKTSERVIDLREELDGRPGGDVRGAVECFEPTRDQ